MRFAAIPEGSPGFPVVPDALFRIRKAKSVLFACGADHVFAHVRAWLYTALKEALRTDVFHGRSGRAGEDLSILKNRKDDKFSQIVRNLKSHDTLEKSGFAKYEMRHLFLTNEGKLFLQQNLHLIPFSYRDSALTAATK